MLHWINLAQRTSDTVFELDIMRKTEASLLHT